MKKVLITGLAVLGIVGTSSVAFATNMQALNLQASQDVSGGSSQLVPTSASTLNRHADDLDDALVPAPTATPSPTDVPAVTDPDPNTTTDNEATEVGESTEHMRNEHAATPAIPAFPTHDGAAIPATPAVPAHHSDGEHENESHSSSTHSESNDD